MAIKHQLTYYTVHNCTILFMQRTDTQKSLLYVRAQKSVSRKTRAEAIRTLPGHRTHYIIAARLRSNRRPLRSRHHTDLISSERAAGKHLFLRFRRAGCVCVCVCTRDREFIRIGARLELDSTRRSFAKSLFLLQSPPRLVLFFPLCFPFLPLYTLGRRAEASHAYADDLRARSGLRLPFFGCFYVILCFLQHSMLGD